MFPGYNFGQQSFQQNPIIGQMPQYQPLLGQDFMQQQMQPQHGGHQGMNPMMFMSPLLASSHSMLPAMFGVAGLAAKHFGLFK